jgi:prophage tail gpP-like protein
MTTAPELDRITLLCETGEEFDLWTEATVDDSFLDPCQTMRLRVGADETRFGLVTRLRKGSQFQLQVNGSPQISGVIDSVSISSGHEGTSVEVTGRDILSPVVDAHIDRRLAVQKGMSLRDIARLVFQQEFQLPVTFGAGTVEIQDNDAAATAARSLAVGRAIPARPRPKRRRTTDPERELQPRSNEGAYAYFSRFAHRVGYHAWARPDGQGVVISSPCYDQDPMGELVNRRGTGAANTIERASIRSDNTAVPSHIYVYGKSSKPGPKSTPIGLAVHEGAPFWKPFYVTDDECDDKEHADAYARFLMGKALRQACVYQVTVRGLSDPKGGGIYNVDTVVNVTDEVCGVSGPMWVEKRTFRKSRAGTFTDLTLIPADSLLLDYYANESLPPFAKPAAARAAVVAKPPVSKREFTGLDYAVIAVHGAGKALTEEAQRQYDNQAAPLQPGTPTTT